MKKALIITFSGIAVLVITLLFIYDRGMYKRNLELSATNSSLSSSCDNLLSKVSSLETENEEMSQELSSLKGGDGNEEYRMPKENVKRVAKVLTVPESYCTKQSSTGLDIDQYNIKSSVYLSTYFYENKSQVKLICNISSNNTVQEKAAFVYYFFNLHLGSYAEDEIEINGCENAVTVIIDNNGNPIVVWLVYKDGDEIKHDMNFVDTDVLAALDEVIENTDVWELTEDQKLYTLPASTTSESNKPTSSSESQPVSTQSTVTIGERNALKKAESYLNYSAFSRNGLIGQLEYEGFSTTEATYGADNVGANWNEQALKKAKNYLDYSAFSYTGLIKQLEYEKFTHEQAVYGADKCNANWNEQAAKMAEQYLKYTSFSRESLINQLEYEGFTHEQAIYGVAQNGY